MASPKHGLFIVPDSFHSLHADFKGRRGEIPVTVGVVYILVFGAMLLLGSLAIGNLLLVGLAIAVCAGAYVLNESDKFEMKWRRYASFIFTTCQPQTALVRIQVKRIHFTRRDDYAYFVLLPESPLNTFEQEQPTDPTNFAMRIVLSQPIDIRKLADRLGATEYAESCTTRAVQAVIRRDDNTSPPQAVIVEVDGYRLWCRSASVSWRPLLLARKS